MSENEINKTIKSIEEVLLTPLIKFYKENPQHLEILAAISKQKTIISLREMDYTITNYSNNNKVIYKLKNGNMFNMYLDYKCQLRGYSKKCLDPFCRRQRIFLDFSTKTPIFIGDEKGILSTEEITKYKNNDSGIITTIGQLNFFKWAITNEVIDFCFNNKEYIVREMDLIDNKKKILKKDSKVSKDLSLIRSGSNMGISKNDNSDETIKVIIQFP